MPAVLRLVPGIEVACIDTDQPGMRVRELNDREVAAE